MSTARMPAAEIEINVDLVRRLVATQFPEWAGLPLAPLGSVGWDNAIYRLGDELVVRLPRRQIGADLVEKEHRWLPELLPSLPLPTPIPLGMGVPDDGYPWLWSVCPWIPGEMAAAVTAAELDHDAIAAQLANFVVAMHSPAPADGPRSAWRGVPLAMRDERTRGIIDTLHDVIDADAALVVWEEALAVPAWDGPDLWLHGDLHPANLLVRAGRLSGVLDFGDLAIGDPATDLYGAWMLLPPRARAAFRERVRVDDATWERGRGWALSLSIGCIELSADNPVIAGIGRRGLAAVLNSAVR